MQLRISDCGLRNRRGQVVDRGRGRRTKSAVPIRNPKSAIGNGAIP